MNVDASLVFAMVTLLAGFLLGRRHEGRKLTREFWADQLAKREAAKPAPTPRELVADPSGWRAKFMNIERKPLYEVPEVYAREMHKEGRRVFLHPFDPIEIDYFDPNGFQCWAKDGGYRIEGVRYYAEDAPAPSLADYQPAGPTPHKVG